MNVIDFIKQLLPLPLKRRIKDGVLRSMTSMSRLASIPVRLDSLHTETEAAQRQLAELAHRTIYLKQMLDRFESSISDLSDNIENLASLPERQTKLELELANCRNLAEVTFRAVETMQRGDFAVCPSASRLRDRCQEIGPRVG